MRSGFSSSNHRVSVRSRAGGFTLIELMVAVAVFAIIMVLVFSITNQTGKIWRNTDSEIKAFQSARAAYESLVTKLGQSTLNTYLDYYDNGSPPTARTAANAATFTPAKYGRNSDLHFLVDQARTIIPGDANIHPGQAVFFLAPLGFTAKTATYLHMPNYLNACGYFVEFGTDKDSIPSFLNGVAGVQERYRFRLMEFLQPTENVAIYSTPKSGDYADYTKWITNFLPPKVDRKDSPLRMVAENIIALIILPQRSPHSTVTTPLAPNYTYDTRQGDITQENFHQLPPLLRVIMVAIDESSAKRLNDNGSSTIPTLATTLSSKFSDATKIDSDLDDLGRILQDQHINYRIFDSTVAIRGAQWSQTP